MRSFILPERRTVVWPWIAGAMSFIGVVHFGFAVFLWTRIAIAFGDFPVKLFVEAAPAVVLLEVFVVALLRACCSRRSAMWLCGMAILASILLCRYDITHRRYQVSSLIMGRGCVHTYLTWWWYEAP